MCLYCGLATVRLLEIQAGAIVWFTSDVAVSIIVKEFMSQVINQLSMLLGISKISP